MSDMAQQSDTTPGGIRDTVTSIIADSIALVRGHIELAKSEIKDSAKAVAIAIAALTIALAMVNLGVIFVFIAAVFGLQEVGLPLWAGFLIVAGSLVVLSLAVVGFAVTMLKRAGRAKRSVTELDATIEAIRGSSR